jgi:hypothetical protein
MSLDASSLRDIVEAVACSIMERVGQPDTPLHVSEEGARQLVDQAERHRSEIEAEKNAALAEIRAERDALAQLSAQAQADAASAAEALRGAEMAALASLQAALSTHVHEIDATLDRAEARLHDAGREALEHLEAAARHEMEQVHGRIDTFLSDTRERIEAATDTARDTLEALALTSRDDLRSLGERVRQDMGDQAEQLRAEVREQAEDLRQLSDRGRDELEHLRENLSERLHGDAQAHFQHGLRDVEGSLADLAGGHMQRIGEESEHVRHRAFRLRAVIEEIAQILAEQVPVVGHSLSARLENIDPDS